MKGTPLQIAAIGNDFDFRADIKKEKDRGVVERLLLVANLSPDEIAQQLEVITGAEAKQANQRRNHNIMLAVNKFKKGLLEIEMEEGILVPEPEWLRKFQEAEDRCRPLIAQFDQALQSDIKEEITVGFIVDLRILYEVTNWFAKNLMYFGNHGNIKTSIFWIHGVGKLQSKSMARDAQLIKSDICNMRNAKTIPARSLQFSDGTFFYGSSLGRGRFLDNWGRKAASASNMLVTLGYAKDLDEAISSRERSIVKLSQSSSKCTVM